MVAEVLLQWPLIPAVAQLGTELDVVVGIVPRVLAGIFRA